MSKENTPPLLTEKEKLKKYLNCAGLEITSGREGVFKEVMSSHGHFTAEDLVKNCRRSRRKISRATVYRCIKEFLEAGVIRKTAFGEKHEHYEHVYDEQLHHHARCIRCYGVIEFPCHDDDAQYNRFLRKKGFQVLGHEMHFYGICQNCRTQSAAAHTSSNSKIHFRKNYRRR